MLDHPNVYPVDTVKPNGLSYTLGEVKPPAVDVRTPVVEPPTPEL